MIVLCPAEMWYKLNSFNSSMRNRGYGVLKTGLTNLLNHYSNSATHSLSLLKFGMLMHDGSIKIAVTFPTRNIFPQCFPQTIYGYLTVNFP